MIGHDRVEQAVNSGVEGSGGGDRIGDIEAVSTRWQAHIRDIAKLVSMERRDLKGPLSAMHQEYQGLMAATLSRAGGTTASGEDGRRFIENIVDQFWTRLPGSSRA